MPKYTIKAYADRDMGLKTQTIEIVAKDNDEAWDIAWNTFPEYHEVGVWEQEE